MTTRQIPIDSTLHKRLVTMISERIKMARSAHTAQSVKWSEAEDQVVAYVSETDSDKLRRSRRDSGEPSYTTLSIPYSYALVMAAHTYWTSVFFARTPVHQFAGRHGEGEMQVQALEAMLEYQVTQRMLLPYYLWFYDAAKYGVGILGTYWEKEVIQYGDLAPETGPDGKPTGSLVQTSNQVLGYEGNCAYNVSPFDFIHDPRVPIHQFQKGEFCVIKRSVSWNDIVRMQAQKHYMNIDQLKGRHAAEGTQQASASSLVKPDGRVQSINVDFADTTDENGLTKHPSRVEFYEFHVDLLQKEWGLGDSGYPEKWVFTITQDLTTIVGVRPLGAIHGQFPFDVIEPEVEAYASYSRGIPETMEPIQRTMDWLLNSHFFNVRQAMNNQFIGDPSRIMMKDVLNSGKPGFFFRIKPEGYGQDVRTMLHQLQVQDVTKGHMADLEGMFGIGEKVLGINEQILGALAGAGRKTATEVRTSTGFGVNRLKTCAEYMSVMGFGPHATKMVQTSQQYFTMEKKLRIVGDSAMLAGPGFAMVTPDGIAGQYDFVHVDGTLPIDRIAQATLWKELMLNFRNLPQLMMQYDIGKIFAYTAQLAGLKNIRQFRIQIAPDAQLQQQAGLGNALALRPPQMGAAPTGMSGMPNGATQAGLNSLGPQQ